MTMHFLHVCGPQSSLPSITSHRLTEPYRIARRLVHGGGMDPLLCAIYTVLPFVALNDSTKGVPVQLLHSKRCVGAVAVVDHKRVLESSV